VGIFNNGLHGIPRRKKGVISLEHDGDPRFYNMARTLLTMGMTRGMKPMNVAKCMGDPVGYNQVPPPEVVPKVVAAKPPTPAAATAPKNKVADIEDTSAKTPEENVEQSIESVSKKTSGANSSRLVVQAGVLAACWSLATVAASFFL